MMKSKNSAIYVNQGYRSPNYNQRRIGVEQGAQIDTIIIHYTDMTNAKAALARLCDPAAKVSAHYLIDQQGTIFALVNEEHRAWHAGVAHWQGVDNINDRSIGIELDYPGHSHSPTGQLPSYAPVQIDALIMLLRDIIERHAIPVARVLGHEDVSPGRKIDPGPKFPWSQLVAAGVARKD